MPYLIYQRERFSLNPYELAERPEKFSVMLINSWHIFSRVSKTYGLIFARDESIAWTLLKCSLFIDAVSNARLRSATATTIYQSVALFELTALIILKPAARKFLFQFFQKVAIFFTLLVALVPRKTGD